MTDEQKDINDLRRYQHFIYVLTVAMVLGVMVYVLFISSGKGDTTGILFRGFFWSCLVLIFIVSAHTFSKIIDRTDEQEDIKKLEKHQYTTLFLVLAVVAVLVIPLIGMRWDSGRPLVFLGLIILLLCISFIVYLSKSLQVSTMHGMKSMPFPELSRGPDRIASGANRFLARFLLSAFVLAVLLLEAMKLAPDMEPLAIFLFSCALIFLAWMLWGFALKGPVPAEVLMMAAASAWLLVMTVPCCFAIDQNPGWFPPILLVWVIAGVTPMIGVHEKARKGRFKRMVEEGDVQGLLEAMNSWAVMNRWSAAEGLGTMARRGRVRDVVLGKGVELLVNHLVCQGVGQEKVWAALQEIARAGEQDHVIDSVLKVLDSPAPEARYQAVLLLGNLGEPAVIPILKGLAGQTEEISLYVGEEQGFIVTSVAKAAREALKKLDLKTAPSPSTPRLPESQDDSAIIPKWEGPGDQDRESRMPAGGEMDEKEPGEEIEIPWSEDGTQGELTEPPVPTCPDCGKEVAAQWRVCQYCMRELKCE